MVGESLVIQKGDRLIGLVHPDMETASLLGLTNEDLQSVMKENLKQLNSELPSFCQISEIKLQDKEFEKTPKKSIKRYLYQNAG